MGKLSRFINHLNDWLAPFEEFCKDENFRGELLASVGAKAPTDPDKKAKLKEKQGKLMKLFQALKDKFDIDEIEVNNIVAFGKTLAEMYLVTKTFAEMMEEFSYYGVEDSDTKSKETAIVNALRAISNFYTFILFRNKAPEIAAFADAIGIFTDEWDETKRALDLILLFELIKLIDEYEDWVENETDLLSTQFSSSESGIKVQKEDVRQRFLKGIFIDFSVIFGKWFFKPLEKQLKIFANFGYETPPELDEFPHAAHLANRVIQFQLIPGKSMESNPLLGKIADSFISFATIPVLPKDAPLDAEPEGYQYLLKFELSATELKFDLPDLVNESLPFELKIPMDISTKMLFGHGLEFDTFSDEILGLDTYLEFILPDPKKNSKEIDLMERGDISFKISPKKVLIEGENKMDLEFKLEFRDLALAFSGEGRDGFLQKILPDEAQIRFSFSIAYSPRTNSWTLDGLDGRDGLFFTYKIGKKEFKTKKNLAIDIPAVYFGLRPMLEKEGDKNQLQGIGLEASMAMGLTLGPLNLFVDRMGLLGSLCFPEGSDGNFLGANLGLDFKPPSGIGIHMKGKYLTGGGALYIDAEKGEYMGFAQLLFKNKYNIKAFGIILTKLPNDKKGFSFVMMLSIETPFQLGLGFQLTGVGGLIGIHRGINISKLQEGMRTRLYDDLLFPENPTENPYGLLTTLNTVFPAIEGQYVIGMMLQIAWGPKGLTTIEVGFLVEFPEPVRVTIIGVLKASIEKKVKGKKVSVLQLQCNFLAIIDFEKEFIRVDALLVNSKLSGHKLEGDLALRIRYGSNPDWIFSIGGFHPNFQPPALELPPEFKKLQIVLRAGNPSIIVSAYLAISPNTLQFGIAGVLKLEKWGVKIRGELSFDVLFQRKPFCFEASVHFLLSASWKGYEFAAIEVNGLFSGPSPWHLEGSLRLKVWRFSKTVNMNETWGEEDATTLESVRVLPLLLEDLGDLRNWEAKAGSTRLLTTIKKVNNHQLLLHPNELLTVRQNTIPLSIEIDKFSDRIPIGPKQFNVQFEDLEGNKMTAGTLKNHFAPAQFVTMGDEEKLNSSSYELFDSGLSFDELDDVFCSDFMSTCDVVYETEIVDVPNVPPPKPPPPFRESFENFAFGLRNNSVANSRMARNTKTFKKAFPLVSERFKVVDASDRLMTGKSQHLNETEAKQQLLKMEKMMPRKKGKLAVLLND